MVHGRGWTLLLRCVRLGSEGQLGELGLQEGGNRRSPCSHCLLNAG